MFSITTSPVSVTDRQIDGKTDRQIERQLVECLCDSVKSWKSLTIRIDKIELDFYEENLFTVDFIRIQSQTE